MKMLVSSLLFRLVPSESTSREPTTVICTKGGPTIGMLAYIPPRRILSLGHQPCFVTGGSAYDGILCLLVAKDAKIYEAHLGISTSEHRVGSYKDFTTHVLQGIKYLGYNVIESMAIMQHACYASFGYQVTSFFAISSWCRTPEELKELINTAHGIGLTVLLDIGGKGRHELWVSRVFNYAMLRFRFYMDEYQFNRFRLDSVTNMMYTHHGIEAEFSGGYQVYFGNSADVEAIFYLMAKDTVEGYLNFEGNEFGYSEWLDFP
ncbi:glycoside hydrolase [Armillaria solidipes]|uniref:Glycoside hydrolase n=1 Tax=Armillaria solidipes TaxID=1076256 RepID=A0A2H3B630_9AGAR|nr:glycoside hydrolase [Armillaria solidipes]